MTINENALLSSVVVRARASLEKDEEVFVGLAFDALTLTSA